MSALACRSCSGVALIPNGVVPTLDGRAAESYECALCGQLHVDPR